MKEMVVNFFRNKKAAFISSVVVNLLSFIIVGLFYYFTDGLKDPVGFLVVGLIYAVISPGIFIIVYELFRSFLKLTLTEIFSGISAIAIVIFFITWVPMQGDFEPYKKQRLVVYICLSLLINAVCYFIKKSKDQRKR